MFRARKGGADPVTSAPGRPATARRSAVPWIVVAAAAVSIAVCLCPSLPLGVPGEWTWDRIWPDSAVEWGAACAAMGLCAAAYMLFAWVGEHRSQTWGGLEGGAWLVGLAAAGFGWLWVAQESAPEGFQLSKAVWVLYFPGPSGYFTEARTEAHDLPRYLATYEQRLARGDYLHLGTHPPGLVVALRGLIELCRRNPGLAEALANSAPRSVQESFGVVRDLHSGWAGPLPVTDRATLWLATLCVQGLAALTVIPLYCVVRRFYSSGTAWLAASLWPSVPALAVFLPKSDALLPCAGIATAALWFSACTPTRSVSEGSSKGGLVRAAAAGAVFWLGLCISLAVLPVAAVLGVWTLLDVHQRARSGRGGWKGELARLLKLVGVAALSFAILTGLVWVTTGLNLCHTWQQNYFNHAAFYDHADQFPRTYWKWLLVNPCELALAVGLPLFAAAVFQLGQNASRLGTDVGRLNWAAAAAGLLLWISGKNSGEAARLWIVMMPWVVIVVAGWIDGHDGGATDTIGPDTRRWCWLCVCQFMASLVLISLVVGFHLPRVGQ